MAASDYLGARLVRLNHQEMAPGDPCPESGCEGHLHQLEQPNVKIYLTGQPLISETLRRFCPGITLADPAICANDVTAQGMPVSHMRS